MNTNEVYSELTCAYSNDHIVREPIHLICGHCICRGCLPNEENVKIHCKIEACGHITEKDLRNEKESILIKRMIKMCFVRAFIDVWIHPRKKCIGIVGEPDWVPAIKI